VLESAFAKPRTLVRFGALLVGLVACAHRAPRGTERPAGPARIEGTAIDSLRGTPLSGAFAELRPGNRQTSTDASGRFRFDSVPGAATYSVAVVHPRLDTLGIALTTPRFDLAPGEVKVVAVAVPPPARLVASFCTAAEVSRGPSAIVGFVRDAERGAPLDSATVVLTYDEVAAGRPPLSVTAVPDAAGRYRFCGLPARMNGLLALNRKGVRTDPVPVVAVPDAPLALRALGLPHRAAKPPR
jgi:hypothetical protein